MLLGPGTINYGICNGCITSRIPIPVLQGGEQSIPGFQINTDSPSTARICHTLARWSSFSVFTPNREMLVLFKLELCINFFTPLICVMSCCFFFFSLSFWVGEGISTSFCLSVTNKGEMSQHCLQCEHPSHPLKSTLSFAD